MKILYCGCCGIDVHKHSVSVWVLVYADSAEPDVRKKEFATHYKALLNLKMWLRAQKATHVAMESTGVYFALSSALIGRVEVPLALE
jgi:transposase